MGSVSQPCKTICSPCSARLIWVNATREKRLGNAWILIHVRLVCPAALHVIAGRLNSATMNQSEFRSYHEREALRLRRLIAIATTPVLKARLLEEAEKHEELVEQL